MKNADRERQIRVYTLREVCQILRLSKATVIRLIHHPDPSQRLEAFQLGRQYRFFDSALSDYLKRCKVQPEEDHQDD